VDTLELGGHVPSGHVLVECTIDLRGHAIDADSAARCVRHGKTRTLGDRSAT
jgi:hypothetical protein